MIVTTTFFTTTFATGAARRFTAAAGTWFTRSPLSDRKAI